MENTTAMPSKANATAEMYRRYCKHQAAEWGHSVGFWVRDNNTREVFRRARLAARWAYKVLGRADLAEVK